jgi:glutamine amidotransferase
MIKVLSYGSGNVRAITNIYKNLGIPCGVANHRDDLTDTSKLVLPGVGAFDQTMRLLDESGMRDELDDLVLDKKLPVLGVCVGMQVMAKSSDEGTRTGLGWVDGHVRQLPTDSLTSKPYLPHMGWNSIQPIKDLPILDQIDAATGFYFLHSYCFDCADPDNVLATAEYGETFTAAIVSDNVYGFQFHPEKSHQNGVSVFRNFAGT